MALPSDDFKKRPVPELLHENNKRSKSEAIDEERVISQDVSSSIIDTEKANFSQDFDLSDCVSGPDEKSPSFSLMLKHIRGSDPMDAITAICAKENFFELRPDLITISLYSIFASRGAVIERLSKEYKSLDLFLHRNLTLNGKLNRNQLTIIGHMLLYCLPLKNDILARIVREKLGGTHMFKANLSPANKKLTATQAKILKEKKTKLPETDFKKAIPLYQAVFSTTVSEPKDMREICAAYSSVYPEKELDTL